MTQKQQLWVESLKTVYKLSPEPMLSVPTSTNRLRLKVYQAVTSSTFEVLR